MGSEQRPLPADYLFKLCCCFSAHKQDYKCIINWTSSLKCWGFWKTFCSLETVVSVPRRRRSRFTTLDKFWNFTAKTWDSALCCFWFWWFLSAWHFRSGQLKHQISWHAMFCILTVLFYSIMWTLRWFSGLFLYIDTNTWNPFSSVYLELMSSSQSSFHESQNIAKSSILYNW